MCANILFCQHFFSSLTALARCAKFLGPSKRLPMGMCVQQCSDDIFNFNKIADTPRVTCLF